MSTTYKFTYKENEITIINEWFKEKLFVNNELQDECIGIALRTRMTGRITNKDNSIELIKVSGGSILKIHYTVFINDKLVFKK